MKRGSNEQKKGRRKEVKSAHESEASTNGEVDAPLTGGRRWAFRLLALLLVPLFVLGGLELALRLAGYGYATGFFDTYRKENGKQYLVNNENFSLRFFPQQLARYPSPVMFESEKPTNTFRVFILGESAARGEPAPAYAASRYLEVLLNQRFPDTHFEIINLGITAIDSHVILPISRECAKAKGDLWIVYIGNNEMVGPFGAATVFGAKAPALGLVRASMAIQTTGIGQLIADLGSQWQRKNTNASWGGMKMFLGNEIGPNDKRKEVVYQNFEQNLNDIFRAGLDSGAKVLLNTVAVNLRDCPPFASLPDTNMPAASRASFEDLYKRGCAMESQSNFTGAIELFAKAAELDAKFADLQYRWGECLIATTHLNEAREHFQRACDWDALPFRADSRINRIIKESAQSFASSNLMFLDSPLLWNQTTESVGCGRETFFEHVHFNFNGNYALGLAWARAIESRLPAKILQSERSKDWANQETCDRMLGLTDWNRLAVIETMIDRMQRPPFSNQSNNTERMQELRAEAKHLRERMKPATAIQAEKTYSAAIQQAPRDHFLHENFAEFLEANGNFVAAAGQWRMAEELLPQSCEPFYEAGRLWARAEHWGDAEADLTKAVRLRPGLIEGWMELSGVHQAMKQFDEALKDCRRVQILEPQNALNVATKGKVLAKLNRHAEAIQTYRSALQMQPDLWQAHFGLAEELAGANLFSQAEKEYRQVIQMRPGIALAHLDCGVMLARQEKFEEALREFQATLELEPNNQTAREYSVRVKGWINDRH